jgi:hypothetical protein
MTKRLKCKDCVNFTPMYPPYEVIYPYEGINPDKFICDGKCHCFDEWFCAYSENYCAHPDFIGEEKSIEDEELTYEFLRHEAERSAANEISAEGAV